MPVQEMHLAKRFYAEHHLSLHRLTPISGLLAADSLRKTDRTDRGNKSKPYPQSELPRSACPSLGESSTLNTNRPGESELPNWPATARLVHADRSHLENAVDAQSMTACHFAQFPSTLASFADGLTTNMPCQSIRAEPSLRLSASSSPSSCWGLSKFATPHALATPRHYLPRS